jgi:lipoprotein NlpD
MKRWWVVALIVLAGCTRTLVNYETTDYVVQPGDTLYAIAWRHGLDPERLAAWNGISDPNLIRPGQRLSLRARASRAAAPARPASRPAPPPPVAMPDAPMPGWAWPTRGRVVSSFGSTGELASGIGIAGAEGQPVVAAAGGRVVYAGSGLIGYGQLIIIKHNETYLSAYGHNRRLLVNQGEEVRQGQQIAEMGLGTDRSPQLHFEIRRNGDPVDPIRFLGASG